MVQDIAPLKFDNTYHNYQPDETSVILSYGDNTILSKVNNQMVDLPRFKDYFLHTDVYPETIYLFSIDDIRYFLPVIPLEAEHGFSYNPVGAFRDLKPRFIAFAVFTGVGLCSWYSSHVYCGKCGNKSNRDEKERMMKCPACGNMVYPTISPAVIVAITDGNRLLMSKYAGREYTRYALLAGFAESGETIEQTVHREVMEEVGVRVKNIRYYKSQPWGLSSSLLMGFFADLDGSPELTVDTNELQEAVWFEREDIPPTTTRRSLTNEMIEYFRNEGTGINMNSYRN